MTRALRRAAPAGASDKGEAREAPRHFLNVRD